MTKGYGVYNIFLDYFRPKRMRQFVKIFGVKNSDKIIDVGGGSLNWSYISTQPNITIGNIDEEDRTEDGFSFKKLDSTELPFEDASFDIAYSNSVIEHVGDWDDQIKFANEIRRVAKFYYVQTPNRWFFVEPHFVAPFIHYLPRRIYRKLIPFFSVWHWVTHPTPQYVDDRFEEIQLLNESQMMQLFPDALLIKEKFLIFTKSLIAVRTPHALGASEDVPSGGGTITPHGVPFAK